MIQVHRQEAEQKRWNEEAERQKQAVQDKAVNHVEMELIDDVFDDTPLPRNHKGLQFNCAVVDQHKSDQDDDDVDDGADDGARGLDMINVNEIKKVNHPGHQREMEGLPEWMWKRM
jgi:hypothetical protein